MQIYLYIGLGGAMGSCLRYLVTLMTTKLFGTLFPLGTICVNLIGAFLLGWFTNAIFFKRLDSKYIAAINTGIIGSFTTLSTLSIDATTLIHQGQFLEAAFYCGISIIGGFLMAFLGLRLGIKEGKS